VYNTLSIEGWTWFGPLDEYEAMTGAGFPPYKVFAGENLILTPDVIVSLKNKNIYDCVKMVRMFVTWN